MLSVNYSGFIWSRQNNIEASNIHSHLWSAMHTLTIDPYGKCRLDPSPAAEIRGRDMECRRNLPSHGENTWISWIGVWRWKMLRLCEIGSRHNSYINMILRQVAFSILTAHFLGSQMRDVSMGVSGRECLTVVFFFFFPSVCQMRWRQEKPFCKGLRWMEIMC